MPRLVEGRDLTGLLLTPVEGFLLSRIDGEASLGALADVTSLPLRDVGAFVERLVAVGAAEWAFESVSLPRPTGRPSRETPVEPFPPPAFPRRATSGDGGRVRETRSSHPKADASVSGEGVHHGEGVGGSDVVDGHRRSQFPPRSPRASHTGSVYPVGDVEDHTAQEAHPFGISFTPRIEEEEGASSDLAATIEALNRVTRSLQGVKIGEPPVSGHAPTEPPPPPPRPVSPPPRRRTTPPPRAASSPPRAMTPPPRPASSPPRALTPPPRPPSSPPRAMTPPLRPPSPPLRPPASPPRPPPVVSSPPMAVPPPVAFSPEQLAAELSRMAATLEDGARTPSRPPPGLDPTLDIDADRQKRINDLYYALDLLDHYQVLGVPRAADKREIRDAYFGLSKVFHPDTLFRKRLGPFKAKMEGIFKRLTEAYDVLGKKRPRTDYDRYLGLQDRTRVVEGAEANKERERLGREAARAASELAGISLSSFPQAQEAASAKAGPVSDVPPPIAEAPAAPAEEPVRQMSEAGREAKRRLMAQRLRNAARVSEAGRTRPQERVRPTASPAVRPGREAVLRDLTDSLKNAAQHTGGVDMLSRYLNTARRAESAGKLAEAADALRLAIAFAPEDPDVLYEHDRVHSELAASLADSFQEQAGYEERNQKWSAAALSWARAFDGRPFDAKPARKAASALLKANGDLHKAKQLAQAAYDLDRADIRNHVTLAQVFVAASLPLNARRVLQEATMLDPGNEMVENLLRSLASAKS